VAINTVHNVTTVAAPDPLAALRAATGAQHELLDSSLPLSKDGATLADYRQHLLMLRAWLAPLNDWLAGYGDGPQDAAAVPPRDYLALIERDLADPAMAGLPPPSPQPADTAPWPAGANAAYRWGVCYVLEGSQLGGAVLYKRLAGALAPHPLAYLRGARPAAPSAEPAGGPAPRWKAFVAALRQALATPDDVVEASRGAVDAFAHLLALRAR
jgi:heme oxygenase